MLKRLIEVALPLKEVSEQSAREKSIRHGHISTLHIWWARRPLAACRAVVFASLIPDPDDPECPDSFRTLVNDLLPAPPNHRQDAEPTPDTPRNRCLEFIRHLVKWENSNNAEIIGKARKLIAAAHKFLHPDSKDAMPKVLDPFAGGGAIPLEALRLGCEAHAIELNPVAHLIELCTLVYPQKYGQPNSRPTPDYIKKLQAAHEGKDGDGLFSKNDGKSKASGAAEIDGIALTRLPLITEAEYQRNPLAADVKFWAAWMKEKTRGVTAPYYPPEKSASPILYFWSRSIKCPNPNCRNEYPLITDLTLAKRSKNTVYVSLVLDEDSGTARLLVSDAPEGAATMRGGSSSCPFCMHPLKAADLRAHGVSNGGFSEQPYAFAVASAGSRKAYCDITATHQRAWSKVLEAEAAFDSKDVPDEPLPNIKGRFNVYIYGYREWGKLFNARQRIALRVLGDALRDAHELLAEMGDSEYAAAVAALLTCVYGRQIDYCSAFCRWVPDGEFVAATLGGEKRIPMLWDYVEVNPWGGGPGDWDSATDWVLRVIEHLSAIPETASVRRGDARRVPLEDASISMILTDPPYYSAIPYADLSDFFYTWERRAIASFDSSFRTPSAPKKPEIVQLSDLCDDYVEKDKAFFEAGMCDAFSNWWSKLDNAGLMTVVFAHKTTTAWDALLAALLKAGYTPGASWPIHTERPGRNQANDMAALASSFFICCRKRTAQETGYWDDIRVTLDGAIRERLDFFWQQGIRGADFFISAIGPALSVYGRYAKVTRLTGEEVTVGQFLDEVRGIVTDYALSQILHGAKTGQIDSETRFYVLWKWSYADAKVPADEAFKLAQALGIGTESMWDRTGVLEKQGENVQALTVAKRMRIKDLGEPNVDGSPAPLIDALHRCCAFRDKGDTGGLSEYLARSGHGRNEKLWTVAQAISEVLPDGDKEKQLLQGLLNQRDKVEEALAEGRLF